MKVIVTHPTGNANVRAIVTGFAKAGILERFFTSVAYFEKSAWLRHVIKDVSRREFSTELKPFTKTRPWKEMARHISNRLGLYSLTENEENLFSIDSVYRDLDEYTAKKILSSSKKTLIYSYEDGSYFSFKAAKKRGLYCVYDLPIAYWKTSRRLLTEEAERLPAWKKTLGGGITDSKEKLARKYEELMMADLVVAPSSFVFKSIQEEAPNKKVIISPFGTPNTNTNYFQNRSTNNSQRLRVLFTGSMGQRKGLADLGEAIKLLKDKSIEFVILGSRLDDEAFYSRELPEYTYEPPRSHNEVLELMSTCDIFCLPSIVEGRALVLQEAMSQGLPIVITPNTGGEDLIREGSTGFMVPIRSPEIIAEKINWFCENREKIKEMGKAAKEHASAYTWHSYVKTIIDSLNLLTH